MIDCHIDPWKLAVLPAAPSTVAGPGPASTESPKGSHSVGYHGPPRRASPDMVVDRTMNDQTGAPSLIHFPFASLA